MSDVTRHTDYRQALARIKQRIQASQTRAVLAANTELLGPYWDIDEPAIGLILCKDNDKLDVEYVLRDINNPMSVSSFITKEIPLSVQSHLPTVEEIESELFQDDESKPND